MAETPHEIETDIRRSREELRSNFQELENRVKSVTDWKQHFANHTGMMLAAAFGAGALLAAATGGRRSRRAT